MSFPYFNGTAVPCTFVSVNRRNNEVRTHIKIWNIRHKIVVDIRIFLQRKKYHDKLSWPRSLSIASRDENQSSPIDVQSHAGSRNTLHWQRGTVTFFRNCEFDLWSLSSSARLAAAMGYIGTNFDVDSSSRFSLKERTHRHTNMQSYRCN